MFLLQKDGVISLVIVEKQLESIPASQGYKVGSLTLHADSRQ